MLTNFVTLGIGILATITGSSAVLAIFVALTAVLHHHQRLFGGAHAVGDAQMLFRAAPDQYDDRHLHAPCR